MNTTEKKVSHTPGPWEIRYGSGIDMKIIAEDFGKVCEIEGPKTTEAMDEWQPVFVANAKLIAAAPQLLKALQMLDECLSDGIPLEKNDPCHRRIKEEIKKATE